MKTKLIEAHNNVNWGKFMVAQFDTEWSVTSAVDQRPLLSNRGWTPDFIWVCDVQTGEGAFFAPHGLASADLGKHQIWVCPLFEPWLEWLYANWKGDVDLLPAVVDLGEESLKHSALWGHRRRGPLPDLLKAAEELVAKLDYESDVKKLRKDTMKAYTALKAVVQEIKEPTE